MRPMYKFIVVDLSHWLDELFLKVLTEADILLMLTGLTIPDLRNLKRLWPYITEWNQDKRKIKIVVNRHDNSSGLQMRDLEHILQQPAYAVLPNDSSALMQCLDQGTSLITTAPRSKLWRSIKGLSAQILQEVDSGEQAGADATASRKRFWVF
jgi:Flp pilus assembly CpaE family ATPase